MSGRPFSIITLPNPMDRIAAGTQDVSQGLTAGCVDDCNSLPSFFVVGPPRTGTSWLYQVLRDHVHLPKTTKETRFFDKYFEHGLRWYLAHYTGSSNGTPSGEIAPTYFASMNARERIALTFPKAKIVCSFRNPVDRVISLYRLKRAYGMIPWSFEEALDNDPELIETSMYATHLKMWLETVGPERVLVTLYDDLREDPQSYVNTVADFIGLQRFKLLPSQKRPVNDSAPLTEPRSYFRTRSALALAEKLKAKRLDGVVALFRNSPLMKLLLSGGPAFREISRDVVAKLYERFRPEVEELEILLKRDLTAWKSANVLAETVHTGV